MIAIFLDVVLTHKSSTLSCLTSFQVHFYQLLELSAITCLERPEISMTQLFITEVLKLPAGAGSDSTQTGRNFGLFRELVMPRNFIALRQTQ